MGFYAPAQLIRDAREHGVEVRPIDVNISAWDCTLEPDQLHRPALRLGLRLIAGFPQSAAQRLVAARHERAFTDPQDLALRAKLNKKDLEALAGANALATFSGNRHQAAWALAGIDTDLPLFEEVAPSEATPMLRVPTEAQNISADYSATGLTLRRHPMALLRDRLLKRRVITAAELKNTQTESHVRVAGLVLMRQAPATANNTTFVTLEDETGVINLIIWSSVSQRFRGGCSAKRHGRRLRHLGRRTITRHRALTYLAVSAGIVRRRTQDSLPLATYAPGRRPTQVLTNVLH
jgi:error-prone DNA polymerase